MNWKIDRKKLLRFQQRDIKEVELIKERLRDMEDSMSNRSFRTEKEWERDKNQRYEFYKRIIKYESIDIRSPSYNKVYK